MGDCKVQYIIHICFIIISIVYDPLIKVSVLIYSMVLSILFIDSCTDFSQLL